MRQITITVSELLLIIFAAIIFTLIVDKILTILFPEPAPIFQVTVNLPASKPNELTAGDHAKGLLKIAWDKLIEGVISVLLPWK